MSENNTTATDVSSSTDATPGTEETSDDAAKRIEALEAANEALRERVAELEAAVTDDSNPDDRTATQADAEAESSIGISRRGALATLASLGLLGAATGPASAHHSGHDHLGETWSGDPGDPGLKLDVGSGTNVALFGASGSTSARALKGFATASSGTTIGVEGKAESPDSIALLGNATATNGPAKGLEGRSAAEFGTGVIGFAKHTTGATKGVRGLAQSPNGRGIEATNTANSGDALGLTAETHSLNGIGIRGDATSSSGTNYGVRGTTASPDGYGLHTPDNAKIDGSLQFTSGSEPHQFIFESGTTNPDQNVISHSPSFPGWGLRYDDAGDDFVFQSSGTDDMTVRLASSSVLDVHGSAEVEGSMTIGQLGASAEQATDIAIADTPTRVVYDDELVDDRSEYDPSTGEFTCDNSGDYHVQAQIFWDGTPSEGESIFLKIRRNGTAVMIDGKQWPTATSSGERITHDVSKTMRNLAAGDTITITAQHGDTGNTHDIIGIGPWANLQISQIG